MTDSLSHVAGPAIVQLEHELMIRDFLDLLDGGCWQELRAFLHDDVAFVTAPGHRLEGRERVLRAVREIHEEFSRFDVDVRELGFGRELVFAELQLTLGLPAEPPIGILSFAKFRIADMQIIEWTQTYA